MLALSQPNSQSSHGCFVSLMQRKILIMNFGLNFRLISLLRQRRSLIKTCQKCDEYCSDYQNEDYSHQFHLSGLVLSKDSEDYDQIMMQKDLMCDKRDKKKSIFTVDPIYQIISEKPLKEEVKSEYHNNRNIIYDIISTNEVAKYRPITPKILRR